jgi:hypothetical protein
MNSFRTALSGHLRNTMPELFTHRRLCRVLVEHSHLVAIYGDAAGLLRLWKGCGAEKRRRESGDVRNRSSVSDIVRAIQRYTIAAD